MQYWSAPNILPEVRRPYHNHRFDHTFHDRDAVLHPGSFPRFLQGPPTQFRMQPRLVRETSGLALNFCDIFHRCRPTSRLSAAHYCTWQKFRWRPSRPGATTFRNPTCFRSRNISAAITSYSCRGWRSSRPLPCVQALPRSSACAFPSPIADRLCCRVSLCSSFFSDFMHTKVQPTPERSST